MTPAQLQMVQAVFHGGKYVNEELDSVKKTRGFTLVEMLIVVAIIGILAAVAYPAYMDSVRSSRRADAMVELNDIAMRLQRCYTTNAKYNSAAGVCLVKDDVTSSDGLKSAEGYYLVKATSVAATTFVLTATPVAGRTQDSDKKCKKFKLDQSGQKSALDSNNADSTDTCWK